MYFWFLSYLSKQIKLVRSHLKWAKEEKARYQFYSNPNKETHNQLRICKERTELFKIILRNDKKDIEKLLH